MEMFALKLDARINGEDPPLPKELRFERSAWGRTVPEEVTRYG